MVGRMDVSRCCCGCELVANSGAATVCSGTWSEPSSGKFRPAGASSVRLYDTPAPDVPWIASVRIDVVASSSPASVGARLIGAATDCDNYVFVEWKVVNGGSNSVQLRLGQVVSGVETILAETPRTLNATLGPCAAYEESLTWSGTKSRVLWLCWDGASLIGWTTIPSGQSGTAQTLQANGLTLAGGKAGYGVDAFSSISTLDFSAFSLSRSLSESKPDCEPCEDHCCKGTVPDELIFELSGIASELVDITDMVAVSGSGRCYFDCERFEGTWYLAKRCPGDGDLCVWSYEIDDEFFINCGCFGLGMCDPVLFTYQISATIITISGTRYLQVSAMLTSYGNMAFPIQPQTRSLAVWRVATDAPCEEWSDWMSLTKVAGGYCQFTGYTPTVRIKKA